MPANIENLLNLIAAVAALGTAAYGLVDATKLLKGGVSHVGFGHILRGLQPFASVLAQGAGTVPWQTLARAHWINGRPRGEQKAILRSLFRMGMSGDQAAALAAALNLAAEPLAAAIGRLERGEELTPQDLTALSRLDALMEMRLDAAYDRAEQSYTNVARGVAGVFAVVLALVAGRVVEVNPLQSLLVGVLAVPLAPVAKDLASSLRAAVQTMKAVKGG